MSLAPARLVQRLSRHPLLLLELLWSALVIVFGPYAIPGGSPRLPFDFMRKLFGEHVHAVGYKYGLAYFEAPFYAVAKALHGGGVTSLAGQPIGPAIVALGIGIYVGVALWLMSALLRGLRLPCPVFTTALGLFGTPLFFYGVFDPGETHAVDAVMATVVIALALRAFRTGWPTSTTMAIGAAIGLSSTVRYFTGVELVALVLTQVYYRRVRAAITAVISWVVVFALLTLPPVAVGVSPLHSGYGSEALAWSPSSPLKMLFTDHRGIFVWTPITILSLIGLARLLITRRGDRPFFIFLALTTIGTIASFTLIAFWDAGYSFSNRYFIPLFPIFVIGVGGLLEWRPRLVGSLATAAAVWSLYLAMALESFFYFAPAGFSASSVAGTPLHNSPGEFALAAGSHSPLLHFIRHGSWPVPVPEASAAVTSASEAHPTGRIPSAPGLLI